MANAILSLKAALISTGIGSAAVIIKQFLPSVSEFIVSDVPFVYSLFVSYLRPPYIYLLINGIIISIVASSKLQRKAEPESVSISQTPSPELVSVTDPAPMITGEKYSVVFESQISSAAISTGSGSGGEENVVAVVPTAEAAPPRINSIEVLNEKVTDRDRPPPSTSKRFSQRKPVKSVTEGKSLGVSRLRRQDTFESTWKAITEGRSMPLTRHLKKSDTWERLQKDENAPPPPLPTKGMKKSETFHSDGKKGSSELSQQQGKIKREPSLSHDELNRRVEAFISKFNEEMRLQRQESLNQYQEMISRGVQYNIGD